MSTSKNELIAKSNSGQILQSTDSLKVKSEEQGSWCQAVSQLHEDLKELPVWFQKELGAFAPTVVGAHISVVWDSIEKPGKGNENIRIALAITYAHELEGMKYQWAMAGFDVFEKSKGFGKFSEVKEFSLENREEKPGLLKMLGLLLWDSTVGERRQKVRRKSNRKRLDSQGVYRNQDGTIELLQLDPESARAAIRMDPQENSATYMGTFKEFVEKDSNLKSKVKESFEGKIQALIERLIVEGVQLAEDPNYDDDWDLNSPNYELRIPIGYPYATKYWSPTQKESPVVSAQYKEIHLEEMVASLVQEAGQALWESWNLGQRISIQASERVPAKSI